MYYKYMQTQDAGKCTKTVGNGDLVQICTEEHRIIKYKFSVARNKYSLPDFTASISHIGGKRFCIGIHKCAWEFIGSMQQNVHLFVDTSYKRCGPNEDQKRSEMIVNTVKRQV